MAIGAKQANSDTALFRDQVSNFRLPSNIVLLVQALRLQGDWVIHKCVEIADRKGVVQVPSPYDHVVRCGDAKTQNPLLHN